MHAGVAEILNTKGDVEAGVAAALDCYTNALKGKQFADVKPEYQQHTKAEQKALVEALVRVWHVREYPSLVSRYNVKLVEKEIEYDLAPNLTLLSTPDCILQEKSTKDLFVYSLKSMAGYDKRAEQTYRADLQGITESLAVQGRFNRTVAGVRYCFLIKGPRYRQKDGNGEETGLWIQDSPLIVAWKRIAATGVAYAHRYKIPNEYGPGYTSLGKGWVKINIWEEPGMTMKKWVEMLSKELVQPTSINAVRNSCHVPVEKFRYPREVAEQLVQIQGDGKRIKHVTETIHSNPDKLHSLAPMNQQSCYYPGECPYARLVCYKGTGETVEESVENAVREGKLEWRKSHHPMEQEWIEKGE